MANLEEITKTILSELGQGSHEFIKRRNGNIFYHELYSIIIKLNKLELVAAELGVSTTALEHIYSRNLKQVTEKPRNVRWDNYLLSLAKYKRCSICEQVLPLPSFAKDKEGWDGLQHRCRECKAVDRQKFTNDNPTYNQQNYIDNSDAYKYRASLYKAAKLQRTPSWANLDKIKEIYRTCPEGYHVDHIVPLQGELVSGLHVEYNLQHLPASENLAKGNKFLT